MKILLVISLILSSLLFPPSSFASHIELKQCIEIAHCSREEINVDGIDKPFSKLQNIIEQTPRTKIIELDGDYLHAEVTSRIMKYIDDLEVSYIPENNIIEIRSESRVGEGDFGVNKKRVDSIISQFSR